MNKKKILVLAMTLSMVAILAIGGTIAYFTDTEEAKNTMVIGNVAINIEEHVKNDKNEYDPFVDDKFVLYPVANDVVGSNWNAHYNKVVRTFNTSPSQHDVYMRTIVLFEKNDVLPATFANEGCEVGCDCCPTGLHFAYVKDAGFGACVDGKETVGSVAEFAKDAQGNKLIYKNADGQEYWVVVFTAAEKVAIPYGKGLHTLNAVWMDKGITSEQIVGWADTEGEKDLKVDILVFSQGIQTYDLTHDDAMKALGEVNATNLATWFNGQDADFAENDYTNN